MRATTRLASTLTAILTAVFGLTVLTASPALAGTANILSPGNGTQVPPGTNTVTVHFGEADDYEVDVTGAGGYYDWEYATTSGAETQTLTFDPFNTPGAYTIEVYDGVYDTVATATFTVPAPPTKLSNVSISPKTFYPLVRDGYKDFTKMSFTLNRNAAITARVYNSSGTRVLNLDAGSRLKGSRSWSWDGRKNDGELVRTGQYKVEITATGTDGTTATASRYVAVTTGYATKRVTKSRTGDQTTSTSHAGSCYVHRYSDEIHLDCWGGKYAQATYRFAIPANAYNLTWGVRGEQSCCSEGKLIRTGKRISNTAFRIGVKVTYWRGYHIYRATLTYSYRARI